MERRDNVVTGLANKRIQILYYIMFTLMLLYYLWMAAQIPYTHDDWAWGTQNGINWLLKANVNSRYAGNAMVVALTRYPVLKTIVMGIVFALIPAYAVRLVKSSANQEDGQEEYKYIYLYILANALMLSVPKVTWMQTFGWVSGFSNYVTVSLAMLIYLLVLTDLEAGKKYGVFSHALLFFFGIVMQLFVENITVCTIALTAVCCVRNYVLRRRIESELLLLFAGNLIGTAIMFSSPIYSTLVETGTAVDGLRRLELDKEAGLVSEFFRLIRFFLYYYPNQIWTSNVWMSSCICLLLIVFCMKKENLWIRIGGSINVVFLLYFLYVKFCGKVEFSSAWWSGAFSAGMALLFFLSVLIQCLILFDRGNKSSCFLIFTWLAAPAVMLPLVIVATGLGRCCLPTQMLHMLFCMMLMLKLLDSSGKSTVRTMGVALTTLFCCICIGLGKVYFDIGVVKRIRDHDVFLARTGVINSIQMKEFPHGDYLWNADPALGDREVESYFRTFYLIPNEVELWFDSWGTKT